MDNTVFQFPLGTEVEFTLSKNRMFDDAILKGTVDHYFKKHGQQTVLQNKEVKAYPVNLVNIKTKSGKFRVDVDCIITKPTQAMIDELNKLAEDAIKAKEKKVKPKSKREYRVSTTFKLGDLANVIKIKTKAVTWLYVASKSSKIFHNVNSVTAKRISAKNAVFFKNEAEAVASGRTHAK